MLKNILRHLRILWSNKIEDTTREWEEDLEPRKETPLSKYIILIDLPFFERFKFLFTNKAKYRLTKHQFGTIFIDPLNELKLDEAN